MRLVESGFRKLERGLGILDPLDCGWRPADRTLVRAGRQLSNPQIRNPNSEIGIALVRGRGILLDLRFCIAYLFIR